MKTMVMYYSRGGNTKVIADAITKELGILQSEQIPPSYPLENVSLLFLGTGEYAGKPDPKVIEFIRTLNNNRVKNVAVYGTSGRGTANGKAVNTVKALLKEKGINVIDETFCCKGKYFLFLNRKKPDSDDILKAKEFARKVYDSFNIGG